MLAEIREVKKAELELSVPRVKKAELGLSIPRGNKFTGCCCWLFFFECFD